jgi:hypothetical protein
MLFALWAALLVLFMALVVRVVGRVLWGLSRGGRPVAVVCCFSGWLEVLVCESFWSSSFSGL